MLAVPSASVLTKFINIEEQKSRNFAMFFT